MSVRVVCDHCGNKIPRVNKFVFGPQPVYDEDEDEDERPRQKRGSEPAKKLKKEYIDLCPHCEEIWMTRVRDLTKRSDP